MQKLAMFLLYEYILEYFTTKFLNLSQYFLYIYSLLFYSIYNNNNNNNDNGNNNVNNDNNNN